MSIRPDIGLPHVTDVLASAGLVDPEFYTQWSRDRGSAVHLATQYEDDGDLDHDDLDPALKPFLAAYVAAKAQLRPVQLASEKFVINEAYRYCGTLDRIWRVGGVPTIVDLKTGGAAAWHSIQTAAYSACCPEVPARANLYLRADGTFKWQNSGSRFDWPVFKAALVVAAWKEGRAA